MTEETRTKLMKENPEMRPIPEALRGGEESFIDDQLDVDECYKGQYMLNTQSSEIKPSIQKKELGFISIKGDLDRSPGDKSEWNDVVDQQSIKLNLKSIRDTPNRDQPTSQYSLFDLKLAE